MLKQTKKPVWEDGQSGQTGTPHSRHARVFEDWGTVAATLGEASPGGGTWTRARVDPAKDKGGGWGAGAQMHRVGAATRGKSAPIWGLRTLEKPTQPQKTTERCA